MNADIKSETSTRSTISITVSAEEKAVAYDRELASCVESVTIKGFRKGKAPKAVVARLYGSKIEARAKDAALQTAYEQVLEQHKDEFRVFSTVETSTATENDDGSFTVSVTVDLMPKFELPAFDSLKIDDKTTTVSDKDVDDAILSFRRSKATYSDADADYALVADDMAKVDYKGTVDGKPLSEVVADAAIYAEKEGAYVTAGSDHSVVPGMSKEIVGKKPGDTFTLEVEFPADFYKESLRGVKASYECKIASASKFSVPDLNDELLASINAKTEEELRSRVRTNLENNAKRADEERHSQQILSQLDSAVSFDLPQSLVDRRVEEYLTNLLQYNMNKGVSKEELSKEREKLYSAARDQVVRNAKIDFIMDQITIDRKINLTNEELNEFFTMYARSTGMSVSDMKLVAKDLAKAREIARMAMRHKVLSSLIKEAKVSADVK